MHKFKRSRTPAIVRFHARHQLIPGILFDPQFQVSQVIGNRVWRDNFYRVPATKQIQRQLLRTWIRAGDYSCQCHKARVALFSAYLVRVFDAETSSAVSEIVRESERPGSKQPPVKRFAVLSGVGLPDRSPHSPPESPLPHIRCTVPGHRWHGETTGGSVTPLESITHALLPGV